MFRAHVFIIRRSKLHYTAPGIITLKQVSGLKLLKYFMEYKYFSNLQNCILVILDHSLVSV